MARPVIIDTDAGVDDALALIIALRSPEIAVKAITTVAGNVEVQKCTRNVLRILNLLNPKDRPVVAQGARKPLKAPLLIAPEVHGPDGLGGLSSKLPAVKVRNVGKAVDTILQLCRQYGKKLTIVTIGPMTNLALALKADRKTLLRAGRIISMGGAFHVPGNTGPVAEFNYYVDPDAAHAVLTSGIPVTVVPLDVTHQVVVMRSEMEYRARRRASNVARSVLDLTRDYMLYHRDTQGFNGGYLHDPLAVGIAIDPMFVRTRRVHVDVETTGLFTRGMTVADFRLRSSGTGSTVDVALKVERDRFLSLFHDRLWM
jgi:purine nucleosidase/pyrimidine-specific ribonucleoside hydrolase